MDTIEARIAEITGGEDPSSATLKKVKAILRDLKRENSKLKEEAKLLYRNNKAMEELVDVLEREMKQLKDQVDFAEKHVYSFDAGGWVGRGEADDKKLKPKSFKKLTVQDINRQLDEILRLMRYHKSKLK